MTKYMQIILTIAALLLVVPAQAKDKYYTVQVDYAVTVETSDFFEAANTVAFGIFGPNCVDFRIGSLSYSVDRWTVRVTAIHQVVARSRHHLTEYGWGFYNPDSLLYIETVVTGVTVVDFDDVSH